MIDIGKLVFKIELDKEAAHSYPVLMQSRSGMIVLFEARRSGTVVGKGFSNHPVGEYREDWIDGQFDILTGSITLEQLV